MVVLGTGTGLTFAPATESITGAVPSADAGVGSATAPRVSSAHPRGGGERIGVGSRGGALGSVAAATLLPARPAEERGEHGRCPAPAAESAPAA